MDLYAAAIRLDRLHITQQIAVAQDFQPQGADVCQTLQLIVNDFPPVIAGIDRAPSFGEDCPRRILSSNLSARQPASTSNVNHSANVANCCPSALWGKMPARSNLIQPVSDRDVLVRLQINIKIHALGAGDKKRAIKILQSIILITPENVDFLAELSMLEASAGHIKSAVQRLDNFLEYSL